MTPSDNRRTSRRARIAIAVRKRSGRRVFLCQASDISTEGMFLAHVLEGPPPPTGKCWLEFCLPGSNVQIAVRGTVVRQEVNARFLLNAVRFTSIAPSHRRLIGDYIQGPPIAARAPVFLPQPAPG